MGLAVVFGVLFEVEAGGVWMGGWVVSGAGIGVTAAGGNGLVEDLAPVCGK